MHIEQLQYSAGQWWSALAAGEPASHAQLVLVFGDRSLLAAGQYLAPLEERFPMAAVLSCSGGGAMLDAEMVDDGLVATAIQFSSAAVRTAILPLPSAEDSERAGLAIARSLPAAGLRHVLVFAEGLGVNGTALSRGLTEGLAPGVTVTGGLAADGDRFESTLVGLDDTPESNRVAAVGLYGDSLRIGIGSFGGWEPIGVDRMITRAVGNTLYELDGRPALELYKELLGPLGYALPASGLLFPLKIRTSNHMPGVIRTILAVDEENGSLTFAGDVPEGSAARLVRTDLDHLIAAAATAAERTGQAPPARGESLALAVSCIGRKLLLQRRVQEELASVRRVLGGSTRIAGFYSYGELAPSGPDSPCELHNQTMTLTTIAES